MEKLLSRAFLLLIDPAVLCILAAFVVAVGTSMRNRGATRARAPRAGGSIPVALRVASFAVVASWLVGYGAQWVIEFPAVAWWRFGVVLLAGAVGVPTVLVHGSRRVLLRDSQSVVLPRRTWKSFVAGKWLVAAACLGVLLVAVTVWAGSMSTPDDIGMYTFLIFGNGGVTSFYGWAYGIPVLVGLVALTASTIFVLQRVAAQRFHRADTVPAETVQRRATSTAVAQIAVGTTALTLASAIQMIGFAGAGTAGGGPPGGPMLEWNPGFSAFSGLFIWGGAAAAFVAVILLLSITAGWTPRRRLTVSIPLAPVGQLSP